ncbi:MAG: ketoacyl-ACP synthase III [Bacteroidales bacterium]|nr:ketoacyl-ACP synthase III [Bacteroidales bacterium]
MQSYIKAISYYLPEKVLTNDDLLEKFPGLKINELTRLTGVKERHIAAENEVASDLAVKSAEKLFSENTIKTDEIDFVIFCTQSNDYMTPSTACIIQDRLNLPKSCGAFDFNQGCTGYIYGLSLSKGLIESGQAKNILLLTAETVSKKIHPEDKSNMAIFGDGASATLISATENEEAGISDFVFGTDGSGFKEIIIKHGGSKFPYPQTTSVDYKDDFGNVRNDGNFYMNGSAVFSFSVKTAPALINEILEKSGKKKEEINLFILHQANQIILESIFIKAGIPKEKSFYCLEKWGNTVSSTIPIALKEAIDQGKAKPRDTIMLVGFGVGFSWAGTVVEL